MILVKADLGWEYFEFSLRSNQVLKLVAVGSPNTICVFSGRKEFPWEFKSQVGHHRFCGLEIICHPKFICMLKRNSKFSTFYRGVLYMKPLKKKCFPVILGKNTHIQVISIKVSSVFGNLWELNADLWYSFFP